MAIAIRGSTVIVATIIVLVLIIQAFREVLVDGIGQGKAHARSPFRFRSVGIGQESVSESRRRVVGQEVEHRVGKQWAQHRPRKFKKKNMGHGSMRDRKFGGYKT